MIYVGYVTPLADATTFLRFILNPRRAEGSPGPILSTLLKKSLARNFGIIVITHERGEYAIKRKKRTHGRFKR